MGRALVLQSGLLGKVMSCTRLVLFVSLTVSDWQRMMSAMYTSQGRCEEGNGYSGTCRTQS